MPNVTSSKDEDSSFKNGIIKTIFTTSNTKYSTTLETSTPFNKKDETTSYLRTREVVSSKLFFSV